MSPPLKCPSCGKGPLLTLGHVLCVVLDCPGPAVEVYGFPRVTVPLEGQAPEAVCNNSYCRWRGTISEAKRKAEDSNPNV